MIIAILKIWGIVGFIYLVADKSKVTSKKQAAWELLLAGPIAWMAMPFIYVAMRIINRKNTAG